LPSAISAPRLLDVAEPPAAEHFNTGGRAPVLLVCDHASRRIPRRLGSLGLSEPDLSRHIAWDIGAAAVTRYLATRLDAPAVLCGYSRLVVDCNRYLEDPTLMPAVSDGTSIAANANLDEAEREQRMGEIFHPYHAAIEARLGALAPSGRQPVLLSIHSCTPEMNGRFRPWHIGICWEEDRRIAGPVLEALQQRRDIVVGDNEPYALVSTEDYTVPIHAMRAGLPHLQVELRQDLIASPAGVERYGAILFEALQDALSPSSGRVENER
jgi:predicted N-formylglutamate amidohydrolase